MPRTIMARACTRSERAQSWWYYIGLLYILPVAMYVHYAMLVRYNVR